MARTRLVIGGCVLLCCLATLVADSQQPRSMRLLSPLEMKDFVKGGAPGPTDPCTASITSYRCSDNAGICSLFDNQQAKCLVKCVGCSNYDRILSQCTGTKPWMYRTCTEESVKDGCGTTRTGQLLCGWNSTNNYCMCGGGADGTEACAQPQAYASSNCIEQP